MILRYANLCQHPRVFRALTGLLVSEFDTLVADLEPRWAEAEAARLSRPDRQRDLGAGHPFELEPRDQMLLSVVWLRQYPTHLVLGFLFGVSDPTVSRVIRRLLPLLEASGRDTMRMPDPGKKRRRSLDQLLADTPALAVIIDTFEQRVQRPPERSEADKFYSGKKKQHTLKSQVAVDEDSGRIVDIADSVEGPTADISLLAASGLLDRLPDGVGAIGDLGYVGIDTLHPSGLAACPRRKPRGQPRPADDIVYNTAFSRRRIPVEHSIGRMRRYQSLNQTDRNHRQEHSARVRAVAGLVNRQLDRWVAG